MVSFAYLRISPVFVSRADCKYANTQLRMPSSHLFEVTHAVDGSELSSRKVPKLSRRYSRLSKKINTMAAPADVWACPACSYSENIDGTTCQMCSSARPRGRRRSVLLIDRSSNHPAAVAAAARGSRGRGPPKARVAAPARESPARGAKEKANERIAAQLAQRAAVPVAEVVHSPSSPDSPLIPPVAAAGSTGAGLGDIAWEEDSLDDDDGPHSPSSCGRGRKTTGEDPTFSPNDDPKSPTDNEVSKYSFFDRLTHYMDGNKISEANRAAVEVCISVEAGAAVRSMDPKKKEKKETAFYNKYMGCLEEIEDCQFADESIRGEMRRRYKKAKKDNNPARLWRKYESDLTDLRNFAKKLPGVGSLSDLPSGSNQLRHMKMPLVHKLWIEKHPV